ncbi:hypothetical protein Zmor_019212 [Zophobas morio]|uniref:Uncharacterized protein n=1 Tax=Zophobas morio TaxID=2755281 RepID=A0AA38I0W1_9CUCU|nr:hypothetical protein Zmor_019212 [Zophobas morio]
MRSLFSPSKTEASKMNNGLSEPRFLKRQFNRPKYLQRNEIVPQIGYAPTWQLANAEWPSFHQQPDFFQSQSQPHATEYSWPKRPSPVFDPAADFSHLQMLPQTEDYSPPQRRPPSDTHFALPSEDSSIATERWPSFGQELGFYPEFSEFSELPEEIGLEESVTPGFISVTPSSAEPEESVTHEFISVTPSSAGVEVPDTPQFIEVKSPPSELGVSFEPELTKVTPPPTESQPQWFQTMTQYFSPTAATEPPELPVTTKILLPPATEAPQFSHITETFLPPPSAPEVFQGPEIIEQYSPPPAPEVFQGPEIIEQYSSPPASEVFQGPESIEQYSPSPAPEVFQGPESIEQYSPSPAPEVFQRPEIIEQYSPSPAPEVFQRPEIIEQYSPSPAPEVFQRPEIIEQYSPPPATEGPQLAHITETYLPYPEPSGASDVTFGVASTPKQLLYVPSTLTPQLKAPIEANLPPAIFNTASNAGPPSLASNVAPPRLTSNVAPPSLASNVAPTSLASNVAPPTLTSNVAPPSLASNVAPTSRASNVAPPSLASNVAPTSLASNVAPPSLASNVAPPFLASNFAPIGVPMPSINLQNYGFPPNFPAFNQHMYRVPHYPQPLHQVQRYPEPQHQVPRYPQPSHQVHYPQPSHQVHYPQRSHQVHYPQPSHQDSHYSQQQFNMGYNYYNSYQIPHGFSYFPQSGQFLPSAPNYNVPLQQPQVAPNRPQGQYAFNHPIYHFPTSRPSSPPPANLFRQFSRKPGTNQISGSGQKLEVPLSPHGGLPIGRTFFDYPFGKQRTPHKTITMALNDSVSNLALEFRKTNDIKLIVHPDGQLVPEVTFKGKMTKGIDGNTVATFHPSGKVFIVQNGNLYKCSGTISETNGQCSGSLHKFQKKTFVDNCYTNDYPKIRGHACVTSDSQPIYMTYYSNKILCETDSYHAMSMKLDRLTALCSRKALSASYKYYPDGPVDEPGFHCDQKSMQAVCVYHEDLLESNDANNPLDY